MMTTTHRTFSGDADLHAMSALANAFAEENMHVTDLPYRFSSWAVDFPENIGLWFDGEENLIGWAMLQTPFWTIDYALHPRVQYEVHPQILAWADERAKQITDSPSGRPVWFINVFTRQRTRIHDLEAMGFASQADVGENSWTKVLMKRENQGNLRQPTLPDGFVIRPLLGSAEVDAYVAMHQEVFESKSMTAAWRQRTLAQPQYLSDLDLVAVAPDGRLAGFCICWLNRDGEIICGQVEPLGVRAEYRKLGLGRSLLTEGLRRLEAYSTHAIYVETDNYRDEAFMLYVSVDFQVLEEVLVFRKDYASF
jgi:mycothiol synthase